MYLKSKRSFKNDGDVFLALEGYCKWDVNVFKSSEHVFRRDDHALSMRDYVFISSNHIFNAADHVFT